YSLLFTLRPNRIWPQGSVVVGIAGFVRIFIAAGENNFGSILLPTNGPVRVIGRLLLHEPAVMAVKSPFNIAAVGTKEGGAVAGLERWNVVCSPRKKNTLSRLMGPPIVPPN